jgi:hypothetical protein
MKEQIIYRKVFIRGEEDLPVKMGDYFVHEKNRPEWDLNSYFYASDHTPIWMNNIDWYLLPVPLPSDEEIKDAQDDYGQKHQEDEFGYTICSITSTAFGGGIKWLKSRLTDK